uniref:Endonuclease/exonuclease/phosphatase domain-containing protein n=1 Tax=Octopus bimaculoides TaxID=37653 RepID=A0A0L8FQG2_OCTBM
MPIKISSHKDEVFELTLVHLMEFLPIPFLQIEQGHLPEEICDLSAFLLTRTLVFVDYGAATPVIRYDSSISKNRKAIKKRPALKLGCWNIRTMMLGLSQDLQDISVARKTAVINEELKRLNVNITALQEIRLANAGPVTLVSVYAPTISATLDAKDEFYENLASTIKSIPISEQLVLMGYLNARLGADNDSWPSCLGPFGVGKSNKNGQQLLELCTFHGLCITNSFFKIKSQCKVSWRHPRSKHWHQLDLILVRRATVKCVLHTLRHRPLLGVLQDQATTQKVLPCKETGAPHIDVNKMSQPNLVEQFAKAFEKEYDTTHSRDTATERWETLQDTIHRTVLSIFGKKTSKSHVCFEAKLLEMTPVIEAKRGALAEYKWSPIERNLQILRAARSKVQHTTRRCAIGYWTELSESIHMATTGSIRGMYGGIKRVLGPTHSKTAPPQIPHWGSITDQGRQMDRWVEHYSELYSRENTVISSALDAIESMLVIEELDVEPTMYELSKVIDSLAAGKAPGSDSIPPDLIKCCKNTLLHPASAGERELYRKT